MGQHVTKKIKQVKQLHNLIMTGDLLVIDPASKSVGYAYYQKAKLVANGEIKAPATASIQARLAYITQQLSDKFGIPDVLAIEEIRGRMAHHMLMWSVGAIVACLEPLEVVEIPISMWHPLRAEDYVKSDALDASLMAEAIFQVLDGTYGLKPAKSVRIRQVNRTKKSTVKKEVAPDRRFGRKKVKPKKRNKR